MKICTHCKEIKLNSDFSIDKRTPDGLCYRCKACQRVAWQKRYTKLCNDSSALEARREYQRQYRRANRDKINAKKRQWLKDNPEKQRAYNLKRLYGLTMDEYGALLIKQSYRCAICGNQFTQNTLINVDHCHVTRKVRGLLCQTCNNGLGCFKNSPCLLQSAIIYLQNNEVR